MGGALSEPTSLDRRATTEASTPGGIHSRVIGPRAIKLVSELRRKRSGATASSPMPAGCHYLSLLQVQ
jgi:hypothetical protein